MIALRNLIRTQHPRTWKLRLQSRLIHNEIDDQDFPEISAEENFYYSTDVNEVKLIGSVVSEPLIQYLPTYNTNVTNFFLATKSFSKLVENHVVHLIVTWGNKKAKYVNQNIKIGSRVYISGDIRSDSKYAYKIHAHKILAL